MRAPCEPLSIYCASCGAPALLVILFLPVVLVVNVVLILHWDAF